MDRTRADEFPLESTAICSRDIVLVADQDRMYLLFHR